MTNPLKIALFTAASLATVATFTSVSPEANAAPSLANKYIKCPLSLAKRTIVNPLPSKWWTTPLNSSLTNTKIIKIGGKRSLVCVYGASGSIQRLEPKKRKCKAVHKGFKCKIKFFPFPGAKKPKTHSTGPIVVPQTYMFDLDKGHVVSGAKADIWFQAKTKTKRFLTPRNGAGLSVSGKHNRGYKGCKKANYTTASIRLRKASVGTYVCVRTNQGRISEFRINSISNGYPKVLKVGYTTWK